MGDDNLRSDGGIVSRLMLWVASFSLVAVMLIIVVDVVLRFVFNIPVMGAYDVVTIGLLAMVFFGIAPVIERGAEIFVDLVDAVLPAAAIRFLNRVSAVGTVITFLFLGWSMVSPARDAWRWGGYSLELGVPEWCKWVLAFVGLAGILWVAISKAIRLIAGSGESTGDPAHNEEHML